MENRKVDQGILAKALKELGIECGDTVFLHSSLKSLGYVDGGPETVIKAFLSVLGNSGTLAVPTFHNFFWDSPDQVWDRQNTPSKMGIISETLRKMPEAFHSPHAPHPIAAVGRLAEDLTERYNFSDFSDDSAFARMIELNAAIVMLGVSFDRCTLFHLFEEKYQVPYRQWQEFSGTVIDNGVEEFKSFPFYMNFIPGVENNFSKCEHDMHEAGEIAYAYAGKAKIMMARAQNIADFISPKIQNDPFYLASNESCEISKKYFSKIQ